MAEPTDFELMRQIQLRDRRSHFLLKDRYQKRLLEIALSTLKQPHQAEEVVRQVFEFCWKHAEAFDLQRDRSVALWLYELTAFQAQKRLRRWSWLPAPASIRVAPPWWPRRLLWGSLVGLGIYAVAITAAYWRLRWQGESVAIQRLYQEWQRQPQVRRTLLRDPSFRNPLLVQALWSPRAKQVLLLASEMPPAPPGNHLPTVAGVGWAAPGKRRHLHRQRRGIPAMAQPAHPFTAADPPLDYPRTGRRERIPHWRPSAAEQLLDPCLST